MHCLHRPIVVFLLLFGFGAAQCLSQESETETTPNNDDIRRAYIGELQDVRFVGCTLTKADQLVGVIQSRASELSFTRQLSRYYLTNLYRNPATPRIVLERLDSVQREVRNELRYYNQRTAESDSSELLAYLNQNGFHTATVTYDFGYDSASKKNVLTFVIDEGKRATIDTVIYLGLEPLVPEVRALLTEFFTPKNTPYSEHEFEQDSRSMLDVMKNNGYYKARTVRTVVGSDLSRTHDTIVVLFDVGNRYRIGHIEFFENANGYPSVNESIRQSQLEFSVGEWYSAEKIQKTRANLLSLGTFDVVSIDTVAYDSARPDHPRSTDSTLSLRVFTKNVKVYDVGFDVMVYQTAIDNYLNLGIGATALYRNTFHGAQATSVSAQYVIQDVSSLLQGRPIQTEALATVTETWPYIGKVFGQRAGLSVRGLYSLRRLIDPFRLESAGLKGSLPVALDKYTYFTGYELSLGLERQVPVDYATSLDEALSNAQNRDDTLAVYQTIQQFAALDSYLQSTGNFLTGIFPGVSLRGEHRDNPVNPQRGTFSNVALEFGFGAGTFVRLQFYNTAYAKVQDRMVLATKVKLGHIQLFDQNNLYVPIERQFFSGGSSSIRSYQSRALHSPVSGVFRDSSTGEIREDYYTSNLVGSGTLLELGVELRWTFARPDDANDTWASFVERSGITFFCDIGNSFNRLATPLYGTFTWDELITGSAVAAGLGYRFDTPVGPFRIDYATSFYDPLRTDGRFIFNGRQGVMNFSNWQLSIGLGHAF